MRLSSYLIAGLVVVLGLQAFQVSRMKGARDLAKSKSELLETQLDATQERFAAAQKLANAKQRAWEQAQRSKDEAAEAERITREAEIKRISRGFAAERGRLRDEIAAYSRGPGPAADTIARCRSEADAIGSVLDEALRVSEACAADGERDAALALRLLVRE